MNSSSDIWFAFARTFAMFFIVLAILILCFYFMKKFSLLKGVKGGRDFIKILSVYHLSPKEKLVLLDVLGEIILIGATPENISKISSFGKGIDFPLEEKGGSGFCFSDFLNQKLGKALRHNGDGIGKERKDSEI